jgi:hypothetical protein
MCIGRVRRQNRVWHDENYDEKGTCKSWKQESLHASQRFRCDEVNEATLEHSFSKKGRLKTRSSTRCLRDFQQKLAIRIRIAERSDNAVVTIHLDCQCQATQHPPEREIPGNEQESERCCKKKTRIVCAPMLGFVTHDVLSLNSGKRENPPRQQHIRSQYSYGCGSDCIGYDHGVSVDGVPVCLRLSRTVHDQRNANRVCETP